VLNTGRHLTTPCDRVRLFPKCSLGEHNILFTSWFESARFGGGLRILRMGPWRRCSPLKGFGRGVIPLRGCVFMEEFPDHRR
jgi:hypothetical protein